MCEHGSVLRDRSNPFENGGELRFSAVSFGFFARAGLSRGAVMPKSAAVTRKRHSHLRWLRPQVGHLSNLGVEVGEAVLSMSIALVKQGGNFKLSAVLSVTSA